MLRKILVLGAVSIMCLGIFAGCSKVEHNAILFDNASEWMHAAFLENNMTQGAGPYHEDVSFSDENLPDHLTYIVINNEKFSEIFSEFPPNVDFENEMLIVYITTNIYMVNAYKLQSLTTNDRLLSVEMRRKNKRAFAHTATAPRQRCFVIKMDKQEITETNIKLK